MSQEYRATIVVVEADGEAQRELAQHLQEAGYRVTPTAPAEARRVIAEERPDLVIVGVSVPNPDGQTLARKIKEDPSLAHTPVLFVSSGGVEVAERIAEVADAYLITPLPPLCFA